MSPRQDVPRYNHRVRSHDTATLDASTLAWCRQQFPALSRTHAGRPVVYFDGPAGTQVPRCVIDAVSNYYERCNANAHGNFATSRESDAVVEAAHQAVADLLGADDPDCVAFGANMTTLTFSFSRALARTWKPGDEVIVTRLDHDANVTPWVLAAHDAGATVRWVDFHHDDCTLDIDQLRSLLNDRTKLVAVGAAANVAGTVNPVADICRWSHAVGAQVFVDAVHFAPHARLDVKAIGCDYLACSAYKFFGPHVGIFWGRPELLESIEPYKLRPAPNDLPGRWMTGTQNFECIAGTRAAVDYLANVGRQFAGMDASASNRRAAIDAAFDAIAGHERELVVRLLAGLRRIKPIRVYGITEAAQLDHRLPTVAFTHAAIKPDALTRHLNERGIFAWNGNCYAISFTESLGLEPDGVVRVGMVHYNTAEELDHLLNVLDTAT